MLDSVHAFQTLPVVEVTTDYDDLEVSVTVAEILPWGVRIECRVEEPIDEGTSIPVFPKCEQAVRIKHFITTSQPRHALNMARWPEHIWTTLFTYGLIFILFPPALLLAVELGSWLLIQPQFQSYEPPLMPAPTTLLDLLEHARGTTSPCPLGINSPKKNAVGLQSQLMAIDWQ